MKSDCRIQVMQQAAYTLICESILMAPWTTERFWMKVGTAGAERVLWWTMERGLSNVPDVKVVCDDGENGASPRWDSVRHDATGDASVKAHKLGSCGELIVNHFGVQAVLGWPTTWATACCSRLWSIWGYFAVHINITLPYSPSTMFVLFVCFFILNTPDVVLSYFA